MRVPVRVHFFPAFLPLAEALPWLLTAFGALAGYLLKASRGRSRPWKIAAIACLAGAIAATGWFAAPRVWWWWHHGESRLASPAELPKLVTLGAAPPEGARETHAYRPGGWHEAWTTRPGRRALSSPMRAGDLYVLGSWEGAVEAYALANGAPVWRLSKREPVFAMAVASPTLLLAGEGLHDSSSSSLTAVRLPGGEPLWQREFEGHIESEPAYSAAGETVWVGTGPGGLWCLDARDGAVRWHAQVGHVDSTPLLAPGDLLLFSSQPDENAKRSTLWALRPADGTVAWSLPLPGQPWGSPQLDAGSGLVLASTGVGQVGVKRPDDRGWAHAVSLAGRKLAWTTELPGNPIEKSVLANGLAIYVLTKGEVIALRVRDGTQAWRLELPGDVQADPVLANGVLAVTGTGGLVSLIDPAAGKLLEARRFEAGMGSAPLFLPDGILITTPYTHARFRW